MQNFVRFNAIESEIELSQEFGKNGMGVPTTELYVLELQRCYL